MNEIKMTVLVGDTGSLNEVIALRDELGARITNILLEGEELNPKGEVKIHFGILDISKIKQVIFVNLIDGLRTDNRSTANSIEALKMIT